MTTRQRRMIFVGLILLCTAGAVALGTRAFKENVMYFISPTELLADANAGTKNFRLGGIVKEGSIQRTEGELRVSFVVTDNNKDLPVTYDKILPDLFREGQMAIVRGKYDGSAFRADEVLAKHDENYMPPEVAEQLAKQHELAKQHAGKLPTAK